MSNIKSDRDGVALLINLTIQNKNKNALVGVLVDIWHCDAEGNYSEYGGGSSTQKTDYSSKDFLRGRQTTDEQGKVSFVSIYPGWYEGRAPHIHVQIWNSAGTSSLLITQIAFDESISKTVYASSKYSTHGQPSISNANDNVFSDSLNCNLLDSISGNVADGYTLSKTIIVSV